MSKPWTCRDEDFLLVKMEIKKQIQQELARIFKQEWDLDLVPEEIQIEEPRDLSHGDLATNLAMIKSKELEMNPREVAEKISGDFELKDIKGVEIAGPGFINFRLTDEYLLSQLKQIQVDGLDQVKPLKGEKIIVEFTDPNPFKELHIGHLYSNTVGEAICKLLEANGAEVKRADYFGDVGMHVGKSLWGLIRKLKEDGIEMKELGERSLRDRIEYMGQAYTIGATAFIDDEKAKQEIQGINKQVSIAGQDIYRERYGKEPKIDFSGVKGESPHPQELISEMYHMGREWSLAYFEEIYARLGMGFDLYYSESVSAETSHDIVQEAIKKGILVKSEGSIIFPEEKSTLHTRVFMNSLGIPTYEAKELGLAPAKYNDYKYDRSIIITGNEIDEYFRVLLKAMELTIPELGAKTTHMSHGMVRLPDGKMSSRTGKIVRAEDILNQLHQMALEKVRDESVSDKEDLAEKVAQASIKYAFLKHTVGSDIEFDLEKSVDVEGDSGPYLQYAYVRVQAILDKVGELSETSYPGRELDEIEKELLLKVLGYEEMLQNAAGQYAPHILCNYLYDLAQTFSTFYASHKIIEAKPTDQKLWVDLITMVARVLEHGLKILGVQVVDKM